MLYPQGNVGSGKLKVQWLVGSLFETIHTGGQGENLQKIAGGHEISQPGRHPGAAMGKGTISCCRDFGGPDSMC